MTPIDGSETAWLSIIVPTRGRPAELRRFIASIEATASDIGGIEVILVTDLDDETANDIPQTRLRLKHRRVPPRLTMGALNRAGYELAVGAWIFLLNDDVVARTGGWERQIRAVTKIFADEICLVHVNDGIFKDKLCTFPIVSRTFCNIVGGICREEYARYRIDDDIYHVFNLLNVSGYDRILYLEGVLFDHFNRDQSMEYKPDPVVHARDTELFDLFFPRRRDAALDLVEHMETVRRSDRRTVLAQRLFEFRDPYPLRRPENVTVLSAGTLVAGSAPRVTVGIVSANFKSNFAQLCIESVKRFTRNFELVLLDNNFGPGFNHSREMNRILSICRTDFLVLMDDDVIVEAGWLDGMLKAMGPDVGVVTPIHKNSEGAISYAGVVMLPDRSGRHGHDLAVPSEPRSTQTLCSAIMLIDMRRCGHITVDDSYSKYFLDIDYGLRVWEAGFRTVLSPFVMVTHVGGATLPYGSALADELGETQRLRFVDRWMRTGRWDRLINSPIWRADARVQRLTGIAGELDELLAARATDDAESLTKKLRAIRELVSAVPDLDRWTREFIQDRIQRGGPAAAPAAADGTALVVGFFLQPVLIEANVSGTSIFLSEGEYFAIPNNEGTFSIDRVRRGKFRRCYRAPDLECVKLAIGADLAVEATSLLPLLARNPRKAPREDGIFMWSLRHPRKAIHGVLKWIGTALKKSAAESK
jgi:GT2 family glycosyltransferase